MTQLAHATGRFFWLFRISPNDEICAYSLVRFTPSASASNCGLLCELSPIGCSEKGEINQDACKTWNMNSMHSTSWSYQNHCSYKVSGVGLPVIAAPGTLEQSIVHYHFLNELILSNTLTDQGYNAESLQIGYSNQEYLSRLQSAFSNEITVLPGYIDSVPYSSEINSILSNLTNEPFESFFNPNWGIYINSLHRGGYWALVPHFVVLLLRLIPNGIFENSLHANPDSWVNKDS